MEERDNDEECKNFTQLSGSPGLSMSLLPTKQKSSRNWSPNVAMVSLQDEQAPISHNIYWKELLMLVYVSVAFLIVHIIKHYCYGHTSQQKQDNSNECPKNHEMKL
ncbi:unnamed protein product [Prunus armeniaca]